MLSFPIILLCFLQVKVHVALSSCPFGQENTANFRCEGGLHVITLQPIQLLHFPSMHVICTEKHQRVPLSAATVIALISIGYFMNEFRMIAIVAFYSTGSAVNPKAFCSDFGEDSFIVNAGGVSMSEGFLGKTRLPRSSCSKYNYISVIIGT